MLRYLFKLTKIIQVNVGGIFYLNYFNSQVLYFHTSKWLLRFRVKTYLISKYTVICLFYDFYFYLEKFTESQIVANAFVLFLAGFETTSTTISFCLYELALKKHIQDRVREEITSKIAKHEGQINNDFLADLDYLEMVIAGNFKNYFEHLRND